MDAMNFQPVVPEANRAQVQRDELAARLAYALRADGTVEPLQGLHLQHASSTMAPIHGVLDRAFCVIAQGAKEVFLGDHRYQYDPAHYLLATIELPVVGQIIEASPARPYLIPGSTIQEAPPIRRRLLYTRAGHLSAAPS